MSDCLTKGPINNIWDAVPASVIIVDSKCQITSFNKASEDLFGVTREKILGQNIVEACCAYQVTYDNDMFTKAVQSGIATPLTEFRITYNGLQITLAGTVYPVYNANQQITGAIGVLINLDKEKQWERRIQHLETLAAIGQIAAGTVHEIRNPLTAIKGFAQLIQCRATRQDTTSIYEYCTLISKEIDHINLIVSDFLTLSRPHEKPFLRLDIASLVTDVLAFLYGESLLVNITVLSELPDNSLYIKGCIENLKEVLINICRNAFQAMQPGGTLTVSVSKNLNSVYIEISDTGCGMDEKTLAHLFEAFYTTKETGTGLGLSICQRIIREHNGEIKVTSAHGVGSTFTIILPLCSEI
ncbi:two-component system sensor histidine kinase NtrB [Dendrosporobacter sp. 1207_IL3150]|uniref:two-component system sensor histidine kinase NtrB n=1 Tax=Dendrosporobacter sp. 1207_IL3150 TaxID=3084054 RepID=UPI002FDADA82